MTEDKVGRLYLIRHALTLPSDTDSHLWPLSSEGVEQSIALAKAPLWNDIDAIYSSPEEKALATVGTAATRYGLTIEVEEALCEARRPAFWYEDYEGAVCHYLRHPKDPPEGWENPVAVERRVTKCLNDIRNGHPEGNIAVCGHGLMFTLYLATLDKNDDIFSVWRSIGFCSVAVQQGEEILFPFGNPLNAP